MNSINTIESIKYNKETKEYAIRYEIEVCETVTYAIPAFTGNISMTNKVLRSRTITTPVQKVVFNTVVEIVEVTALVAKAMVQRLKDAGKETRIEDYGTELVMRFA